MLRSETTRKASDSGSIDVKSQSRAIGVKDRHLIAIKVQSSAIGVEALSMNRRTRPRLYVVGVGSVSALGVSSRQSWAAYAEGRQAVAVRSIGPFTAPVGCIDDRGEHCLAELSRSIPDLARLDRSTCLAFLAAREAWQQSCFEQRRSEVGVILGSSRGATETLEARHAEFLETGRTLARTSPTTTLGNLASGVARNLGASALCGEISSACSSSLQAFTFGASWLLAGLGQICLVGGAEAPLTPFTLAQMRSLGLMAKSEDPKPACRPLARAPRNGLVLSEGACVLALERPPDGMARRALAEISGIGSAVDRAPSPTGVSESGEGILRAMSQALSMHGRGVDAVVMHAPGTIKGDLAERVAVQQLLGRDFRGLCSAKWQMGHTLGASGAFGIDLALGLLSGIRQKPAPYPSYLTPPSVPVTSVMVNAAGFGGSWSSVILKRVPGPA